jgi:hypothetical protein
MRDEDLFDFLLGRWERTAADDRSKVFRELCAEINTTFTGRAGKAAFVGSFIGEALGTFPDIDDQERRTLLAIAKRSMEDSEADEGADEVEDDEDRPSLSLKQLRQKRKEAKAERDAVLKEFNERYAVVNENGTVVIFADRYNDVLDRHVYDRLTVFGFQALYQNRKICTRIDDEGRRTCQPVAKWWLNHEERRQFIYGVTFAPREKASDGILNLWRGYNFEPKEGSWELLKAHFRNIICGGNVLYFDYLMGWMARAIQFPGEPGEVAIVLRGKPRCGKGTVGHVLRKLFGQHGMHISSSKHLVGNFNAHLRDCVLLFADEAFFAGDKASVSTLRAIITEKVHTIESKYVNAVQCKNMLHLIMASNDDWVVPVIPGEVRFFVLDVLPDRIGDHAYFNAIHEELEAGGYAAMLHDLLHYDLTGFNVRAVPQTAALLEQKHYTLDTTNAWWRDVLERGYVYQSKMGLEKELHVWLDPVSTQLLCASYSEFASARRERHPLHRGALMDFLRDKMGCEDTRPRGLTILGEHKPGRIAETVVGMRARCFRVGTLEEARTAFEKSTGLPVERDPEDPDLPVSDDGSATVIPF